MDGLDSADRGVGAAERVGGSPRHASDGSQRLLPGSAHRRRIFRRHPLLARRDDDDLRRAADGGRAPGRGASRRLSVTFSRRVRGHHRSPASFARCSDGRAVRGTGLGRERAWPAVRLGRLSLGAPRIQPGERAADRSARERDRRLWPFVSARADRGRGGSSDCGEAGPHAMDRGRRRCLRWSPAARSGAAGGWRRVAFVSTGDAIRVGGRAGQHRPGREVESGPARRDHRPLRLDDEAGGGAGGDVRHLARVGISRSPCRRSPRPSGSPPGARDRSDAPHRQRPGRAHAPGRTARRARQPLLQRRLPRQA